MGQRCKTLGELRAAIDRLVAEHGELAAVGTYGTDADGSRDDIFDEGIDIDEAHVLIRTGRVAGIYGERRKVRGFTRTGIILS